MHRYQVLIEYVGTNFIGWQIQPKGVSIQKLIQIKISKLLKQKINLIGSGRTDAGVHAIGQSAHFDSEKKIKNLDKFLHSLNHFLNDNEVIFYETVDDLSDKLNYFKNHDDLRRNYAEKGKEKYFRYFNSTIISDYIIAKSFDIKIKEKLIWM